MEKTKKNSERELSLYILQEIMIDGAYNNIALKKTFDKNKQLNSIEKAFITELVNGTLRNVILIDYIIDKFSKVKTNKIKPFILYLLRISIFQFIFMDKVPNSAICNEAVNLCKQKSFSTLSGFVNGVLRNIMRNYEKIEYPSIENEPIKHLSVLYSYPEWIIDYWLEEMSFDQVHNILKNNSIRPKITACINSVKINKEQLLNIFKEENIDAKNGYLSNNSLIISKTGSIAQKKSYIDGLYHVMDESSMISVEIANIKETDTVIDLCSAPGGKAFYSAYIMKNKGTILAYDIYDHKVDLLNEGIDRLKLTNIKALIKDSTEYDESLKNIADVVLVDVPCSGLGLIRKKPDIKYTKNMKEIDSLVKLQRSILEIAVKYTKIGGTLMYTTCTISKKENIDNVNWVLDNFDFELQAIDEFLPDKLIDNETKKGYIQIIPSSDGCDGFFIAKMIRRR